MPLTKERVQWHHSQRQSVIVLPVVRPVESGDSKVRDHFLLVSLTLPVGVLGHLLPSGFTLGKYYR